MGSPNFTRSRDELVRVGRTRVYNVHPARPQLDGMTAAPVADQCRISFAPLAWAFQHERMEG